MMMIIDHGHGRDINASGDDHVCDDPQQRRLRRRPQRRLRPPTTMTTAACDGRATPSRLARAATVVVALATTAAWIAAQQLPVVAASHQSPAPTSTVASRSAHIDPRTLENYCYPDGDITDTFCEFRTVESVNDAIYPLLEQLIKTSFFRYFHVDLNKGCPFWNEDALCHQKDCAVVEVDDESLIPEDWKTSTLSSVDFSSDRSLGLFQKKCEFNEKDFCVVDDELSPNGVYVDLLKNPERFTGYAGESAARIWRAVYTENCFERDGSDSGTLTGAASVFDPRGGLVKTAPSSYEYQCMEKRVYYRLISGLHASISSHICDKHLNRSTGEWYPDLQCFTDRLAKFPDRIENLYFTYVVVLRSLAKLSPYLSRYAWCTGAISDKTKITSLMSQILHHANSAPSTFDEKLMFASSSSAQLKEEFKNHFRNISRVMDCVGCDKCRLWGKLQISGLGTALKVLFSFSEEDIASTGRLTISRQELVALVNGFSRLSDSLQAVERFRKRIREEGERERIALKRSAADRRKSDKKKEEKAAAAAAGPQTDENLNRLGLASNVSLFEPRFIPTYAIGLIVLVLGFIRLLQKGWQMHKGELVVPEPQDDEGRDSVPSRKDGGAEGGDAETNGGDGVDSDGEYLDENGEVLVDKARSLKPRGVGAVIDKKKS